MFPRKYVKVFEFRDPKHEIDAFDELIDAVKKKRFWKEAVVGDMVIDLKRAGHRMSGVAFVSLDARTGEKTLIGRDSEFDDSRCIPRIISVPHVILPDAYAAAQHPKINWHSDTVPVDPSQFEILEKRIGPTSMPCGWGVRDYENLLLAKHGQISYAVATPKPEEFIGGRRVRYMQYCRGVDCKALDDDDDSLLKNVDYVLMD